MAVRSILAERVVIAVPPIISITPFKKETSLGLESYEDLGFKSEEELELEISKLTKFRPEYDTNME